MTDKTNVITVTQDNLEWINKNVPGSSKQKRLEAMLAFYVNNGGPIVGTPELTKKPMVIALKGPARCGKSFLAESLKNTVYKDKKVLIFDGHSQKHENLEDYDVVIFCGVTSRDFPQGLI